MTTTEHNPEPPDRILIEAARREGLPKYPTFRLQILYMDNASFRAHCDTLTELDALGGINWPVDRAEAAAREAWMHFMNDGAMGTLDVCREAARLALDEEWQP